MAVFLYGATNMSIILEQQTTLEQILYRDPVEERIADFQKSSWDFWLHHNDLMKSDTMMVWQTGMAETEPCKLGGSDCDASLSIVLDTSNRNEAELTWMMIKAPIVGRGGAEALARDTQGSGRQGVAMTVYERGVTARRLGWDHSGNPLGEAKLDRQETSLSIASLQGLLTHPAFSESLQQLYARVAKADTALERFRQEEESNLAPTLFAKKLEILTKERAKAGFLPYGGPLGSKTRSEVAGELNLRLLRDRLIDTILQDTLF